MIDVFIVEDEEAFCELLTHALLETKKVRLVGTAHSGEAAPRKIPLAKPEPKLLFTGYWLERRLVVTIAHCVG